MDKAKVYSTNITEAPIAILGVPFDNVNFPQTIALIEEMIASGRPHYLATANVDFLVQAMHDVELRRILFDAHLVICDGTPLVWASRLLGNPLPERVAGSDLVPLLIKLAAEKGYRPFFLGATPDVAEKAVAKIKAAYPALDVAGYYSPPFNRLLDMDHEEITRRIRESRPDFLFVGFGCPKQEKWISMHYRSLGVPVSVGIGGTIDFLAGKTTRAPRWMQVTGTEWIFRLLQEPRRLAGRYLKDLYYFSGAMAAQWWRLQFSARAVPVKNGAIQTEPACAQIQFPSRLDIEAVHQHKKAWEEAVRSHPASLLDLSAVEFIDSTGVGLLIRLQKLGRALAQPVALVTPSEVVCRALQMMRLQDFFLIAPHRKEALRQVEETRAAHPAQVKTGVAGTAAILYWQGEITAVNAEEVWELSRAYLAERAEKNQPAIIDCAALHFIDSTGLSIMLRIRKTATRQGLQLALRRLQDNVLNVLRLAKVEEYLLANPPREKEQNTSTLVEQSLVR